MFTLTSSYLNFCKNFIIKPTIPIQEQNLPEKEEAIRRQNFIKFAETKLQIHIKEEEILAIHDLHKRRDGTVPIIVKFMRSSTKQSIMINRKKLKKSDIFINEHLTQRNMEIEKKARKMKKDGVKSLILNIPKCKIFDYVNFIYFFFINL